MIEPIVLEGVRTCMLCKTHRTCSTVRDLDRFRIATMGMFIPNVARFWRNAWAIAADACGRFDPIGNEQATPDDTMTMTFLVQRVVPLDHNSDGEDEINAAAKVLEALGYEVTLEDAG